ncbi:MAG TPA: hypothetical protein VJ044_11130 [Candidatus Hodarchaeales archaeon]|nr:hypothetical protein [Candidatus Hodarchaeales archaeon]
MRILTEGLKEHTAKQHMLAGEYYWIIEKRKTLMFHPDLPAPDRNWEFSGQFLQINLDSRASWNGNTFPAGFLPYRTFIGSVVVATLYTMRVSQPLKVKVWFPVPHALLSVNFVRDLLADNYNHDHSPGAESWRKFIDLLPSYSSLMRPDVIPVDLNGNPVPVGLLQIEPTTSETIMELWTQDKDRTRLKVYESTDYLQFQKNESNLYKITCTLGTFACHPQIWSAGFPDKFAGSKVTIKTEDIGEIVLEDVLFSTRGHDVNLESIKGV